MNTTNGKIAAQSRRTIAASLLQLMEREDYREITITQIAQEAEFSRKTFYRLFAGKEEVLQYLLDEKAARFMELVIKNDVHHYWELMLMLFRFWGEEREFVLLLKRHGLLYLMNQSVYGHAFEVILYVRSRSVVEATGESLPYLLAYSIGGMCSMLQKWIEDDMAVDPQMFVGKLKEGFQAVDI